MLTYVKMHELRDIFLNGKKQVSIYPTYDSLNGQFWFFCRAPELTRQKIYHNEKRIVFAGGAECRFVLYNAEKLYGLKADLILVNMRCTREMESFLLTRLTQTGILRQGPRYDDYPETRRSEN